MKKTILVKLLVVLTVILVGLAAVSVVAVFFINGMKTSSVCVVSIETSEGGTTNPKPGGWAFTPGDTLNITALPYKGYVFDSWLVDTIEFIDNPLIFKIDEKKRSIIITVIFKRDSWCLNIMVSGKGKTIPEEGEYYFPKGDDKSVSLSAIPGTGWAFSHFTVYKINKTVDEIINPLPLIIDCDITVMVYFEKLMNLTISVVGDGTTIPDPLVKHEYSRGSIVELRAIPNGEAAFVKWAWSGGETTQNPFNITMDSDWHITVYFCETFYLRIIILMPGGTTNPAPNVKHYYPKGTTVRITAIPNPGFALDFFHTDAIPEKVSYKNPLTVLMDHDWLVWVYFATANCLTIDAEGGGSTNPPGGVHYYPVDREVTVKAVDAPPVVTFSYWSGDVAEADKYKKTIKIKMDTDKTLVAHFICSIPEKDLLDPKSIPSAIEAYGMVDKRILVKPLLYIPTKKEELYSS